MPAREGIFTWGNGTKPWPWPEHRYMKNIRLVEHFNCHETFKETGVHYLFQPDTSSEGFEDDLGLQTDLDP